jgi:hypothetical protein
MMSQFEKIKQELLKNLKTWLEYLSYKKRDFLIIEVVSIEIMSLPMNLYVSDEEIEYRDSFSY